MFQMAIRMKREKHGFPFCNCLELKEEQEQQSSDSLGHNYMFNWLAVRQRELEIAFPLSCPSSVCFISILFPGIGGWKIGLSVWAVIPTNPLQTFPDYKSLSDGRTFFLLPTDVRDSSWTADRRRATRDPDYV